MTVSVLPEKSAQLNSSFNNTKCETTGIVFIDPKVDDYEMLMAGVKPGLEVVLLDDNCDGISQITQVLKGRFGLSSLHIVAHGEAGKLLLGNGFVVGRGVLTKAPGLCAPTLEQYKNDLQSWATAFAPDASILLYGCNVAVGEKGQHFVRQLSNFTGAAVAASNNLTGSVALGGDWELGVKIGNVKAPLAFGIETIEAYSAVFTITRISVGSDSRRSSRSFNNLSISADGRYMAFESFANNLVSDDTNNARDIFIYDTVENTTRRISVDDNGTQGNSESLFSSISADGRYVAFVSYANNLVSDDTNNVPDIFVYDTIANTTRRVSVDNNGIQGDRHSLSASISADGRYVAFESYASNLVSGDTNRLGDIFVYDTVANTTRLVSISDDGIQGNGSSPSISADGRYVAFASVSSRLVSGDTNGLADIFVYDTVENTTRRVSMSDNGIQSNRYSYEPTISADGRYVAFVSEASNLVSDDTNNAPDVFVYDTVENTTRRVSINDNGIQGNASSNNPSISGDGRYVTFASFASNLVSGDTNNSFDIFVYDTVANTTRRVSVANTGIQGNSTSNSPSISADGRYVAFTSFSSNLVSGDTNNTFDIFLFDSNPETRNLWTGTPQNDSYTYTGTDKLIGYGLQGNDTITGNTGNDILVGGRGSDRLLGRNGDDKMVGGIGNDTLLGGAGNDLIDGSGFWNDLDILTGGIGADTFVLGNQRVYYRRDGYATITDFRHIQGDKIQLYGNRSQYQLRQDSLVGSAVTDTSIYYVGDGFDNQLIGVVQDSVDVSFGRDIGFV